MIDLYTLIIVDYNTINETIQYLDRCQNFFKRNKPQHIMIIENGSNEGVIEHITKLFGEPYIEYCFDKQYEVYHFKSLDRDICYCNAGENLGYAKGNNLGAKISRVIWNDKYYIISNNDIYFEKEFEWKIVEDIFTKNKFIGIVGPKVVTPEGVIQSPQRWVSPFKRLIVYYWFRWISAFFNENKKSSFLLKYCNDVDTKAISGNCAWVSGCFMILYAEAFHKVGLFDENTFLYAEEMILSRRMEKYNYSVYYCDEVEVIHRHAATTKKSISIMQSREFDFRSVLYYYEKYCNTSKLLIIFAKINFNLYKIFFNIYHLFVKSGGN